MAIAPPRERESDRKATKKTQALLSVSRSHTQARKCACVCVLLFIFLPKSCPFSFPIFRSRLCVQLFCKCVPSSSWLAYFSHFAEGDLA